MTNLVELLAECDAHEIRLSLAGDSELTIDAPQDALTPDLIGRLKAHKSELLAILTADPVRLETRQQVYAQTVERVNAAYQGGQLDWLRLDAIEKRIWGAETMAVLMLAVEDYEYVV